MYQVRRHRGQWAGSREAPPPWAVGGHVRGGGLPTQFLAAGACAGPRRTWRAWAQRQPGIQPPSARILHVGFAGTGHTLTTESLPVLDHDLFGVARATKEPGQGMFGHEVGEVAPAGRHRRCERVRRTSVWAGRSVLIGLGWNGFFPSDRGGGCPYARNRADPVERGVGRETSIAGPRPAAPPPTRLKSVPVKEPHHPQRPTPSIATATCYPSPRSRVDCPERGTYDIQLHGHGRAFRVSPSQWHVPGVSFRLHSPRGCAEHGGGQAPGGERGSDRAPAVSAPEVSHVAWPPHLRPAVP